MLKNLGDGSHFRVRVCRYEALKAEKGVHVAKKSASGRLEEQSIFLNTT
jgi:hypothetical protein